MEFPPEHYFQTATQRIRLARHLYEEGASFALAIYVGGLAFHPNGKLLVSGGGDELIKCWDISKHTAAKAEKKKGHNSIQV